MVASHEALLADSSIVKMKLYIIHSAVKKIINEPLIPKRGPRK